MSNPEAKYYAGYFILEDNLNEGLKGAIIAKEIQTNNLNLLTISQQHFTKLE
jgi:hypothetical protein